jgi:uncharacterized protein YgiM (DUF1202 family)
MKHKLLLFPALLALTAAAVLAQSPSAQPAGGDSAISAPAPASGANSAAEPKASPAPGKKAGARKRIPFDPPVWAVAKSDVVNVRDQPSFRGEVVGHLKKGETVIVQARITLSHPKKGEPAEWSEISIPSDLVVWVNSHFIDPSAKTVTAHRINLRGGPGENYSIVGRLEKGATVTEIRERDGWTAIQAPSNAYAFVAAEFLDVQAAPAPEAPPPQAVIVPPVVAAAPAGDQPVAPPPPAAPPAAASEPAPSAPAPTVQGQADQELAALRQTTEPSADAKPRIVTREGYVHRSYNLQAPASYELHDIQTDSLIEFLQASTNINLHAFVGTRITVTGPELIDQRWPRTPILQVQSAGLIP